MTILKDGTQVEDPRLGRLPEFDRRSLNFPIQEVLKEEKKPLMLRSYTWSCAKHENQQMEGSCVSFAWTHDGIARPVQVLWLDAAFARKQYKEMQKIDQWPGENYEGTSVIAGAKIMRELGFFGSFHWGFSLEDVCLGIPHNGPCVFGLNWHRQMFNTNPNGFLDIGGPVEGGHAILGKGVRIVRAGKNSVRGPGIFANVDMNQSYVLLHNSWGPEWGMGGDAKIGLFDLNILLHERGEACFPTNRRKVTA